MVGSIVVLVTATAVWAAVAICRLHLDDLRSEVGGARVLQAVRDLGGRATALQVTTQIGWRDGEHPYPEVRTHLESMAAEGTLRMERVPVSQWDTTLRPVYVLSGC